jgi:hypothetical protein
MEVQILKAMKTRPASRPWKNEPMDLQEIIKLEKKYNKTSAFPRALREFLFLAGQYNNVGFDFHHGLERLQERSQEALKYNNQKIDRPFFAFDQLDDCEQFTFVFLDEDQEDPDVYIAYPYYVDSGTKLINRYSNYTFSTLVLDHIERIESGRALE